MRTPSHLVLCVALVACSANPQSAGSTEAYKLRDPGAEKEIEAILKSGFDEMNRGSFSLWKNTADPAAVAWDVDEEGKPVSASGKEEIDAMLDGYKKIWDSGTKVTTTIDALACRSSTNVGHCLVEFDQTFTKDGKTMGPVKLRGTANLQRVDGNWLWTHWHSSERERPAPE